MKKISTCIIALIFSLTIFISQPVKAAETVANVNIRGEVKKGNSIEITVDLENASNLYGGDIKFRYDKEFLKVESITPNRDIISENYMQHNKPENGDKARFYFTMQGDSTGYSGSANFVKIKANVLKDGELKLNSKNLFLQLVEKPKGKDPVNMQFILKVDGVEMDVDQGGNSNPDTPDTPDTPDIPDIPDNGSDNNDDGNGESNSGGDTNKPNEGAESTEGDGNSTNSGNSIGNSIGSSTGNKIGNIISSITNPDNSNENSSDNKDNSETIKNKDNENKSEDELVEDSSDEKNLLTNKKDSEEKSVESNNYIIYGGIVLVLVCGVACYIYIKNKKKS